ncbi:MAG: tryptophan synthase subunit alpha [Sphingomonas bacterium]|nr:tryptophan synthase subunit alpha [Sphingomonas bacterium]
MSRYAAMFEHLAAANEAAFGGFLMLGYPDPARCGALLDALVEGGADMVEVGIPFSDPVADGPVIAAAAKHALEGGVRTADCLAMIADFRARHPAIPVGILTYANIVVAHGREHFCAELADAGADSLLVADVPSIEAAPWAEAAIAAGIDPVLIGAPTTPQHALETIARLGRGYTYCVARLGVTGSGVAPTMGHRQLFDDLARLGAPPPILGFGISSPAHVAEAVASGAAGVISGSALVERAALLDGPDQVRSLCAAMKAATCPS